MVARGLAVVVLLFPLISGSAPVGLLGVYVLVFYVAIIAAVADST